MKRVYAAGRVGQGRCACVLEALESCPRTSCLGSPRSRKLPGFAQSRHWSSVSRTHCGWHLMHTCHVFFYISLQNHMWVVMGINITRRKWCHERMVIEKYRQSENQADRMAWSEGTCWVQSLKPTWKWKGRAGSAQASPGLPTWSHIPTTHMLTQ